MSKVQHRVMAVNPSKSVSDYRIYMLNNSMEDRLIGKDLQQSETASVSVLKVGLTKEEFSTLKRLTKFHNKEKLLGVSTTINLLSGFGIHISKDSIKFTEFSHYGFSDYPLEITNLKDLTNPYFEAKLIERYRSGNELVKKRILEKIEKRDLEVFKWKVML